MADEQPVAQPAVQHDYAALSKFAEAAIKDPLHPVYAVGFAKSVILQRYAVDVMIREVVKPEQFWVDYPDYANRIEEAIKLCEQVSPDMVTCPKCGEKFAPKK